MTEGQNLLIRSKTKSGFKIYNTSNTIKSAFPPKCFIVEINFLHLQFHHYKRNTMVQVLGGVQSNVESQGTQELLMFIEHLLNAELRCRCGT